MSIKSINEAFNKKFKDIEEVPSDYTLRDLYNEELNNKKDLKEALESIIKKLDEAPMSDEDKRESEILRNLYKRIGGKNTTKFTPEEQEVMDKYGLDAWGFRGDTKVTTPGKNEVVKYGDLGKTSNWNNRFIPNKNADKINFADRARKTDSRDWGRKYAENKHFKSTRPNELERQDQAREMKRPYNQFRSAKNKYKDAKKDLDDFFDNTRASVEKANNEYQKTIDKLDSDNSYSYHKKSLDMAEKDIQDILNKYRKKIESLVRRFDEASMSDQDKKDSDLLKSILNKIDKRSNAALTPEEKDVLNKYGLVRSDRGFNKGDKWFDIGTTSPGGKAVTHPNYNLADKVRKVDRDYGRQVRNYGNYWRKDTFQDLERKRDSAIMGKDVDDMKNALDSRKYYQNQLASEIQRIENEKNKAAELRDRKIKDATDSSRYFSTKEKAEKSKAALNDIRRKYGLPTEESLKEACDNSHMTRVISTNGDPKINSAIIHSVLGQLSDGIWENSPGMEGYWTTADTDGNGNIIVDDRITIYGSYKDRPYDNKYARMSDDEVRKYFVNKAKYIAQLYMHDNNMNPYRNWNADNEEECGYMSGYSHLDHDPTIGEIYQFVQNNK